MKSTWQWTIVNGGGACGFGAFGQDSASEWVLRITIDLHSDGVLYEESLEGWIEAMEYMDFLAWPLEKVLRKHWDFNTETYRRGEADEAFRAFTDNLL
jgi:hypothetical protein